MLEAGNEGGHQIYNEGRASVRVHYGFGRLMRIFPKEPTGRDAEYIDPEPEMRDVPAAVRVYGLRPAPVNGSGIFLSSLGQRERNAILAQHRLQSYPW